MYNNLGLVVVSRCSRALAVLSVNRTCTSVTFETHFDGARDLGCHLDRTGIAHCEGDKFKVESVVVSL